MLHLSTCAVMFLRVANTVTHRRAWNTNRPWIHRSDQSTAAANAALIYMEGVWDQYRQFCLIYGCDPEPTIYGHRSDDAHPHTRIYTYGIYTHACPIHLHTFTHTYTYVHIARTHAPCAFSQKPSGCAPCSLASRYTCVIGW